ncbi:hypothetical protein [Empedobacter tilapiae]
MKKVMILFGMFYSINVFSQIGINIKKPQSPLHIDVKGDTNGLANTIDDVVIDANGNFGIGTIIPTNRLEVHGNSVVTSDDLVNGNLDAKTISAQGGIRIGKDNVTNVQSSLEIYGNGFGTGLRLENEPQINDTNLRYVPVMTQKSNDGVLAWENLPMVTTTIEGMVNKAIIKENWTDVTPTITLDEPGYWIIFISFTVHTGYVGPSNENRSNIFLQLVNATTGIEITRGASPTESMGLRVGSPQFMHVLKVDNPITVKARAKCNFNINIEDGQWGDPKFYAIKIN